MENETKKGNRALSSVIINNSFIACFSLCQTNLCLYLHGFFFFDAIDPDSKRVSELFCIFSFYSCIGIISYLNC